MCCWRALLLEMGFERGAGNGRGPSSSPARHSLSTPTHSSPTHSRPQATRNSGEGAAGRAGRGLRDVTRGQGSESSVQGGLGGSQYTYVIT